MRRGKSSLRRGFGKQVREASEFSEEGESLEKVEVEEVSTILQSCREWNGENQWQGRVKRGVQWSQKEMSLYQFRHEYNSENHGI